ncbi:TPA: hypothetical protein ENX78_16930 [Candidatus Poribacteria bacterium]|nr:hypothetical protein [Candidatus Poribacteria bacterium]
MSNICIISVVIVLIWYCPQSFAKILYQEDFEKETIGREPISLEKMETPINRATARIEVADDPEKQTGKVAQIFTFALYVPKIAERDNWTNWYWEWDWRWDTASNPGNAYRIKDGSNFFHFTPRSDGMTIKFYIYNNGNWVEKASAEYQLKLNKWYRFQQIMQGDYHAVKIKERIDNTPFDKIKPAIEMNDGTFKKGAMGGWGTDNGSTWIDNIIIYENPRDVLSVSSEGKLPITWGILKKK